MSIFIAVSLAWMSTSVCLFPGSDIEVLCDLGMHTLGTKTIKEDYIAVQYIKSPDTHPFCYDTQTKQTNKINKQRIKKKKISVMVVSHTMRLIEYE